MFENRDNNYDFASRFCFPKNNYTSESEDERASVNEAPRSQRNKLL